jgi:hypothetical protein
MSKDIITGNPSGQAMIEYLLVFSFMILLSINMVKGLGKTTLSMVGVLGYELTEQLSVGVCKEDCFYSGYSNQDKGP